jgi:hypothetical protein
VHDLVHSPRPGQRQRSPRARTSAPRLQRTTLPRARAGAGITQTFTFSTPVRDPLVAVWSVGFAALGAPMVLEFDSEPSLLSTGISAYFVSGMLEVSGRRLTGIEGNGVLQFKGTFTALSFTIPEPEPLTGYGGITVGIRGRAP